MALKVSLPMTRCCLVLCTSTIGLSPWTVTRLFERADAHLDVDGCGQRPGEDDPLAPDGVEPLEREGERVGARRQADDPVSSGAVADRGAALLDQDRAGGFDGDARQHGAGWIPDHAGDRGLNGPLAADVARDGHRRGQHHQKEQQTVMHTLSPQETPSGAHTRLSQKPAHWKLGSSPGIAMVSMADNGKTRPASRRRTTRTADGPELHCPKGIDSRPFFRQAGPACDHGV